MTLAVRLACIPSDEKNIIWNIMWERENIRYCLVQITTKWGTHEIRMSNDNHDRCPSFKKSLLSKVGMRLIVTDAILVHREEYDYIVPEIEIQLNASSNIFVC